MATNRIDILDPALLRPGRIDRKIEFPPPNEEARLDILKIHSRKMNLTRGINLRKIAELMPGASGAEVKVYIFFFYTLIGFFLPSNIPHLYNIGCMCATNTLVSSGSHDCLIVSDWRAA
jgi:hypothetical protein